MLKKYPLQTQETLTQEINKRTSQRLKIKEELK